LLKVNNIDWVAGNSSPRFLEIVLSVLEKFPDDCLERIAQAELIVENDESFDPEPGESVVRGRCLEVGRGPIVLYEQAIWKTCTPRNIHNEVKRVILHELAHAIGASESTITQLGY
jgi:predicted Zn-dependent protease with MMP-like domain